MGSFTIGSAAHAQDSSAELRDFKLEPEKPKPAPPPLPQPGPEQNAPLPKTPLPSAPVPVRPPAASPTTIPSPALTLPDVPVTAQRSKRDGTQKNSAVKPAASEETLNPETSAANRDGENADAAKNSAVGGDAPASETPTAQQRPFPAPATDAGAETGAPSGDAAPANGFTTIWAVALLASIGAIIAIGAFLFLRRRKKEASNADADIEFQQITPKAILKAAAAPGTPSAPITADMHPALPIVSAASAATATAPPAVGEIRPQLQLSFVPEKATISLAMLTIKGQIRIVNAGAAEAKSVRLKAAIISASEDQSQQIAAFQTETSIQSQDIGGAVAGERVGMEIDLTIPLNELNSFPLGERRLFVPIVLANIDYEWGDHGEHDEARISCMIGREATPPKPKMAPLRLDLGPRSFAKLGQRPIFA